jgi:hypothetical protein
MDVGSHPYESHPHHHRHMHLHRFQAAVPQAVDALEASAFN